MDFNYWLTVSNFKHVTIDELKQLCKDYNIENSFNNKKK